MSTREEVYRALDGERDYQEEDPGIDLSSIDRTLHVIIMCIAQYSGTERVNMVTHVGDRAEALELLRKVGALCVGCMEVHGAPQREEYDLYVIESGKTVSVPGRDVPAPASTGVQTVPVRTVAGTEEELDAMLEDMGETGGC